MIQQSNKRKINEIDDNDVLKNEIQNRKKPFKNGNQDESDETEEKEKIEEKLSNNNTTESGDNSSNNNNNENSNNRPDNKDDKDNTHEIWKSIGLNSLDMKVLFQYIKSKGDLSIVNNEGYGLIYLAAKNNSLEALRILLLQSDTPLVNKYHGPHSEIALHAAASVGNFDALELLVEHGSEIATQDSLGHTPLSNSLFANNVTCTEFLIKSGAPVDTIDTQGNTLLHLAVSNHFTEAIPLLIQHGVNIDQVNQRGLSPLAVGIGFGYKDIVDALIKGGADVNGKTRFGKIIHHAVTWNRIDALESLINAGAEVNVVNAMEESPLLVAVQQRKIDIVRFLLKHGADPCFSSSSTPSTNISLLYAANHGCTELCSLLINQDTSSYFILQAADMSERASFPLTAKYLRSRVYNINNSNNNDGSSISNSINNNINGTNGSENENSLILPSLNDEDSNRNFENDFNSLINTFSDDDDNTSINNNNDQSQPSNPPSLSGQL